ncbi:hypothetical protein BH23GEM3_BH23GEM3_06220 [soil metagenome]|nr:hypothetical protein [Gemmatimonadota bacterium]
MSEMGLLPLRVVDARELDTKFRAVLRPGEPVRDRDGTPHQLPAFFYEVPSWNAAMEIQIAPHFRLSEFLHVDVREADPQRRFPRYVPLAITLLAAHLEVLREAVDTYVHISANGGYRSPAHALSASGSPHLWGTAANIYRIGDDFLDTEKQIARYTQLVREVLPGVWVRPYGHGIGFADDHLHLDLGHLSVEPRGVRAEDEDRGGTTPGKEETAA